MGNPVDLFTIQEVAHDPFEVADELSLCLEAALNEIGIDISVPSQQEVVGFYPDNIRVNKLAYMAIEYFNLPLIRTWYKYGQYEPYTSLRADQLYLQSLGNENRIIYEPSHRNPVTRDAVYSFFLRNKDLIKSIWEQDLYEFMIFNYGRFAPGGLKEMYIANTGILRTVEKLHKGEYSPERDMRNFKRSAMDLRYSLDDSGMFREKTSEKLIGFLYLLEDALDVFNSRKEVSSEARRILRDSMYDYHSFIWAVPSLEIAVSRTEGPDDEVDDYRQKLEGHIPGAIEALDDAIDKWEVKVDEAGLIPTSKTYSSQKQTPVELGRLGRASARGGENGRQ